MYRIFYLCFLTSVVVCLWRFCVGIMDLLGYLQMLSVDMDKMRMVLLWSLDFIHDVRGVTSRFIQRWWSEWVQGSSPCHAAVTATVACWSVKWQWSERIGGSILYHATVTATQELQEISESLRSGRNSTVPKNNFWIASESIGRLSSFMYVHKTCKSL